MPHRTHHSPLLLLYSWIATTMLTIASAIPMDTASAAFPRHRDTPAKKRNMSISGSLSRSQKARSTVATVPLEEGVPLVFAVVVVVDAIRGVLSAVEGVATVRPPQRPDFGVGPSPHQEARRVVRRLRREGAQAPVFPRLVTPVALFVMHVGRGRERERELQRGVGG